MQIYGRASHLPQNRNPTEVELVQHTLGLPDDLAIREVKRKSRKLLNFGTQNCV
jgi:hypothetical protein